MGGVWMGENRRGHISPPEGLARGELKRRTSLEELWAGGLVDQMTCARDLGLDPKGTRRVVRGSYQAQGD